MTAGTCTVYFTSHTLTLWALRDSRAVTKKKTQNMFALLIAILFLILIFSKIGISRRLKKKRNKKTYGLLTPLHSKVTDRNNLVTLFMFVHIWILPT